MKAAAAVLAASLLFFVGVLTGAGRREALPPPTAIPLGAENPASSSGRPTSTQPRPSAPPATTPTPPRPGSNPSTATTAATTRTDATAPSATSPTAPVGPTATTTSTTSTSTTDSSGKVQQVDNQVDCTSAGKQGKGKREPCPSTTTSTGEAPGGGRNR